MMTVRFLFFLIEQLLPISRFSHPIFASVQRTGGKACQEGEGCCCELHFDLFFFGGYLFS